MSLPNEQTILYCQPLSRFNRVDPVIKYLTSPKGDYNSKHASEGANRESEIGDFVKHKSSQTDILPVSMDPATADTTTTTANKRSPPKKDKSVEHHHHKMHHHSEKKHQQEQRAKSHDVSTTTEAAVSGSKWQKLQEQEQRKSSMANHTLDKKSHNSVSFSTPGKMLLSDFEDQLMAMEVSLLSPADRQRLLQIHEASLKEDATSEVKTKAGKTEEKKNVKGPQRRAISLTDRQPDAVPKSPHVQGQLRRHTLPEPVLASQHSRSDNDSMLVNTFRSGGEEAKKRHSLDASKAKLLLGNDSSSDGRIFRKSLQEMKRKEEEDIPCSEDAKLGSKGDLEEMKIGGAPTGKRKIRSLHSFKPKQDSDNVEQRRASTQLWVQSQLQQEEETSKDDGKACKGEKKEGEKEDKEKSDSRNAAKEKCKDGMSLPPLVTADEPTTKASATGSGMTHHTLPDIKPRGGIMEGARDSAEKERRKEEEGHELGTDLEGHPSTAKRKLIRQAIPN